MYPPENEPPESAIEIIQEDEERSTLRRPFVPDDVRAELVDRLDRSEEEELDALRGDNS